MANIKFSVINGSTVLPDSQVERAVGALQTQVRRDYAPVWGTDADLIFVPTGQNPEPGSWWLTVLDNSDQAGALGYHDVTSEGLPLGKVFAKTDMIYGLQWTVTASHELLEMLGDPDINLTAFVQPDPDAATGLLYAYEVCDACENDQFGYDIDGSLVSDFVYPAWFESFRQPGSTPFDYQKKISKPFELLPGGYIGVFDVTAGNGWQQIIAPEKPGTRGRPVGSEVRPHIGSRRERRRILRSHWVRSRPIEAIHENTRRFREYPRGSRG